MSSPLASRNIGGERKGCKRKHTDSCEEFQGLGSVPPATMEVCICRVGGGE